LPSQVDYGFDFGRKVQKGRHHAPIALRFFHLDPLMERNMPKTPNIGRHPVVHDDV
jgi:hypothetical protein